MEKVTKKTTVVGFAEALKQTLDIISKKMNEQQNQVELNSKLLKDAHCLIDALGKQVNSAHSLIDNLQREIDELQNPTLFDK